MKKTYVTLSIIIMLLSLLAACVNDAAPTQPQETDIVNTTGVTAQPTPSPTKWPEAYSTILEEYKTLAGYIFQDADSLLDILESDNAEEWEDKNIPVLSEEGDYWGIFIGGVYLREYKDAYGYALKDLNGDGSDELILLLRNYKILAVYSTADGKPKLVDQYWDRYSCYAIDESGLFYIHGSDGAEDWSSEICRVSDDGSELLTVAEYGMSREGLTLEEESYYFKVIDGKSYSEREIITEAEFDEFYEKYPVFADWENAGEITENVLVFIPILG